MSALTMDSFAVETDGPASHWMFRFDGSVNGTAFIEGVRSMLLATGWTEIDQIKAWGGFYIELGWSVVPRTLTIAAVTYDCTDDVSHFLEVAGVPFCQYDPYAVAPSGCNWVPWGDYTQTASAQELAAAVSACLGLTTTVEPGYALPEPLSADSVDATPTRYPYTTGDTIRIVAPEGGTAHNGITIRRGEGGSQKGSGVDMWGGGYQFRSAAYNGNTYDLFLTEQDAGHIRFSFRGNGGRRDVFVDFTAGAHGAGGIVHVVTSGRQLVCWLRSDTPSSEAGWTEQGFLVSMPWSRMSEYALFLVGASVLTHLARNERNDWSRYLTWIGNPKAIAFDGPLTEYQPGGGAGAPGMLVRYQNQYPVQVASAKPLLYNAYLTAETHGDKTVESRVVGKLWNAFVLSEHHPGSPVQLWGDRAYICVASQPAYDGRTPASLWIAVG